MRHVRLTAERMIQCTLASQLSKGQWPKRLPSIRRPLPRVNFLLCDKRTGEKMIECIIVSFRFFSIFYFSLLFSSLLFSSLVSFLFLGFFSSFFSFLFFSFLFFFSLLFIFFTFQCQWAENFAITRHHYQFDDRCPEITFFSTTTLPCSSNHYPNHTLKLHFQTHTTKLDLFPRVEKVFYFSASSSAKKEEEEVEEKEEEEAEEEVKEEVEEEAEEKAMTELDCMQYWFFEFSPSEVRWWKKKRTWKRIHSSPPLSTPCLFLWPLDFLLSNLKASSLTPH